MSKVAIANPGVRAPDDQADGYAALVIPELTVQQRKRRCGGGRRPAWWHATDARCCRCMRPAHACQCPASSDPEGYLSLGLATCASRMAAIWGE
jgi:hypothetical protein